MDVLPNGVELTGMLEEHAECCVRPGAAGSLAEALREMVRKRTTSPRIIDVDTIRRQRVWSDRTFGRVEQGGQSVAGVVDHITRELKEIEAQPDDVDEWADLVILALDGAGRAGHGAQTIIDAVAAKQLENEAREWPDWRKAPRDKAIEHVRSSARLNPGEDWA